MRVAADAGTMNPGSEPMTIDARRFASVERLLGAPALQRLRGAHVVVVGLGGVGSWAAEALARSGIGRLTLVDLDHVAQSNLNRQLQATLDTIGAAKVEAMRERILAIVPDCVVDTLEAFVTPEGVAELLPGSANVVIDAIDAPRAKAAMIRWAADSGCAMVVCGAAGGRRDPLALRRVDLADARGDRLLAAVRSRLRRDYGFAPPGQPFGVIAIQAEQFNVQVNPIDVSQGAPLACAGYGSIVTVTAPMGFAAAAAAIDLLLQ